MMKKMAILLAAIMVMSLSMTACNNTDNVEDDYEEPDITVSDTVEDKEESETSESESKTEESEEKSEVNLYENDDFSFELPLGWIENPSEKDLGIAFVAPGKTGENVIITYNKMSEDIFAFKKDDFQAELNKIFGTEVNIENFGVIDINGAEVFEVEYNLEKDGKKFVQTYRYQNNGDKTLTYVYTNVGEERTENCEKIYNTLKFKNAENSDNAKNTEDASKSDSTTLYENDFCSFDLGEDWKLYVEQDNLVIFMSKKTPENGFATNITVVKENYKGNILKMSEEKMTENLEKSLGSTIDVKEFGKENVNGKEVIKFKYAVNLRGVDIVQTQYYFSKDNGDTYSYSFSNGGTESSPEAEEIFTEIKFK